MADDLDVEAMLEAPYKKEDHEPERNGKSSPKRNRSRDRDGGKRRRSTSKGRERKKSRSRSRDRRRRSVSKTRERRRRSRSKSPRDRRRRSRSPRRRRSRSPRKSRSPRRDRDRGDRDRRRRTPTPPRTGPSATERRETHEEKFRKRFGPDADYSFRKRNSEGLDERYRKRNPGPELTPEERDARTVFCMQLASSIRPRDLEEFFSSVGKVRDCRIITDNKTRKSKGIAYIEFESTDSVALALGLTGQKLKGIPILVQVSQAEKNRQANAAPAADDTLTGPMRLYVGSLHFNITEDMLRGIFEPFGKIDHINLVMDPETNRSKGFGFVTFHAAEDAKKALDQLNGFELAGRPMKVGHVTERAMEAQVAANQVGLDTEEMDRAGVDLGATGRLQLMAKLAESSGMQIPQAAASALQKQNSPSIAGATAPPIATQCFMLSNMFSPENETNPTWDSEIRDDVIDECNKHGGVLHLYVDKISPQGNVYVKCPTISAAAASVQALHGRFFAGKVITAAYVPLPNYHQLFPDSQTTRQLIMSNQALAQQQLLLSRPTPHY